MTTVFSRLARSCVTSVFVLIAVVPVSSRAEVPVAMTESPQHLERHRESTRQFSAPDRWGATTHCALTRLKCSAMPT